MYINMYTTHFANLCNGVYYHHHYHYIINTKDYCIIVVKMVTKIQFQNY